MEAETKDCLRFYSGKRVFVTGHTGFKGAWLCAVLRFAGAAVTGFSLPPEGEDSLFSILGLERDMRSFLGDIRDGDALRAAFDVSDPELVFHLAAQPIVRESYRDPAGTCGTNVMGTVNLLECIRRSEHARSVVNVTTDKVYRNREWVWGYRETDELGGFDPYASSKACSELLTECYRNCFLAQRGVGVSTARAGNVIGGGDFGKERIIPDCVRAVRAGVPVKLRSPRSVRPYQHVLEALHAYLLIGARQYDDPALAGCYNVGPDRSGCTSTGELAELFCRAWGTGAAWEGGDADESLHEAELLCLDSSRIRETLGWKPCRSIGETVADAVDWTRTWLASGDVSALTERQIRDFPWSI